MAIHDLPSLSISLQQNNHYQPGDRVIGTVSISSPNDTTIQLDKLQLVWHGSIKSTIGHENEQCVELFHETRQIDLGNSTAKAFVLATAQSPPPPPLDVKNQSDLSFDLYLVKGMPSSLEISEPQAQVQISYMIQVTGYYQEQLLQHQLCVPVVATTASHQIDEQEADQQQTNEVTYLVDSNTHDPSRSAARVTVPCRMIPRGMILPVVGHIWLDRSHSREKAISLELIRHTTITCHDREETLVHEMDSAQFGLELVEHQDYAVQTLSQSLWIPPDCVPALDISAGRLVNIRYQIRLKVDIDPDAVYTHAEYQTTTDTMAVDVPIIIYAKSISDAVPSPSASTNTQLSQPTSSSPSSSSGRLRNSVNLGNNGRMRERFKSMFKKRDSMRVSSSTAITNNNNSKSSSTTSLRGAFGSLKIKSSNNSNNNDHPSSSINTTTTTTTPSSSRNSSVAGSISPPHSSSLPPKAFSSLPLSSSSPPAPLQTSFLTSKAISQDDDPTTTAPLSLPILRSLSIRHPSSAEQQSTLPMMTSTTTITEPVPPIPLVEGGGVYTFHIFADSSDEEDNVEKKEFKIQGTQTSSLSRSDSFISSVGKQGSLDTTPYNQHAKEDLEGSDTEDTQIYTVSSAGIGKLDQVSDSSDEDKGGKSSEEEDDNDLLSLLAKRERRIERKKDRGSSSRHR